MDKSESIKNLAVALAKFQADVRDPRKEANNPFFKSKYVTLDALVDCVRPVLAKYGLSFIQSPAGDGQNISVTTLLLHESGEWIESEPFTMRAAKVDPQGAGSAVTYGRRYTLQSILGVTWCEKDDDGNAASIEPAGACISKQQQKALVDKAKEVYGDDAKRKVVEILGFYGYEKTGDISPKDYNDILNMIKGE